MLLLGVVVGDLGGQHAAFSYPLGLGLLPHPLPYVTSASYDGVSQNPRSSASGRGSGAVCRGILEASLMHSVPAGTGACSGSRGGLLLQQVAAPLLPQPARNHTFRAMRRVPCGSAIVRS